MLNKFKNKQNSRAGRQAGFIKLIIVIIIGLLVMRYFGITVSGILSYFGTSWSEIVNWFKDLLNSIK